MKTTPRRFGILAALTALFSIPRPVSAREIPTDFAPRRRSACPAPKSVYRERAEAKELLLEKSSRMAQLIQRYRKEHKARHGVHCSYQVAGQAVALA